MPSREFIKRTPSALGLGGGGRSVARLGVPVGTVGDAVKVVLDMGGGVVSVGVTDGVVSPPLELVGPVRMAISIY